MLNSPLKINVLKYQQKDDYYFYDLDSGVFAQSNQTMNRLLDLIPNNNNDEIMDTLEMEYSRKEIRDCLQELGSLHNNGYLFCKPKSQPRKEGKDQKTLTNLWLNVAHDCNLRCIYCFGKGGSYGGKRNFMTIDTAKKCIDYWYHNLGDAKKLKVSFFGGEPFLNQKTIIFAIDYINHLFKNSDRVIKYNFSTNGTIFNDSFIRKLADNKAEILFSIDGVPEVHDFNRPFATGKGSHRSIIENIEKFNAYFDQLSASIVVTKKNAALLKKSVQHLWEIGFNKVNFFLAIVNDPAISLSSEDLDRLHPQIAELNRMTYDNLIVKQNTRYTCENTLSICKSIHKGQSREGCAFQSDFAVMFNPSGDIFKCYQLLGNPELSMGNVNTAQEWYKTDKTFTKPINQRVCNDCWAVNLCGGGCAFESFEFHNDLHTPYEISCKHIKFLINEAFKLYTDFYRFSPKLPGILFGN
jgi:uncharacterized protein